MKRRSNKYIDRYANKNNTPNIIENTIIIISSYLFLGLNLISAAIYYGYSSIVEPDRLFVIGILMLLMAIISVFDNRKEMRNNSAAVMTYILFLLGCIVLAFILSVKWIIIYIIESFLSWGLIFFIKTQKHR